MLDMDRQDRAGSGSDDEEHWQRKEARRLVRDKAALNPLTLGALRPLLCDAAVHMFPVEDHGLSERGSQSASRAKLHMQRSTHLTRQVEAQIRVLSCGAGSQ